MSIGYNRDKYVGKCTGEEIDNAVNSYKDINAYYSYGKKMESSISLPVNLNEIKEVGNYIISNFTNGTETMNRYTPINLEGYYQDNIFHQAVKIGSYMAIRNYVSGNDTWTDWTEKDLFDSM